MNIYNQIQEKKNEITKNLMLLEIDERFIKLLNILKQKYLSLDNDFLKHSAEQTLNLQKYYANLCLFFDQDVMVVVNLYHQHKQDDLSIYDNSTKEINNKLQEKINEIKKCLEDTENAYHDKLLTNYLTNKYELIIHKYDEELSTILNRNEIALINQLTDNYQDTIPLTVYYDCTLTKERCIDELSSVLDDFINYLNSLMENKKQITTKEQLIETTIEKINNSHLLEQFTNLKNNYYESITHINNIDTRIGNLQKNYYDNLTSFYEIVLKSKQVYDEQTKITAYFTYLQEIEPAKLEINKLAEIKVYLQNNFNHELQKLLIRAYYEIIKLEVRYNNGTTYVYQELTKTMSLDLELLFLEDLKQYKDLLIKNNCYEEFLTSDFNLELLTKFTEIIMPDNLELLVDKYSHELLDKMNTKVDPNFKENLGFTYEKKMFDDLGETVIETVIGNKNQKFYVTRNGQVLNRRIDRKKIGVQQIINTKYHDGIFTCYGYNQKPIDNGYTITWHKKYYIVAYDAINNRVCFVKKIPNNKRVSKIYEYSDGLVCVEYAGDDDFRYYYNLSGKLTLKTKNSTTIDSNFNNGYLAETTINKVCYYNKSGRIAYQEKNDFDFGKKHVYDKTAHSFSQGIAVIEHHKVPSLTKIIDVNFKKVLTGFQYLEYEVITEDGQKVYLPYFKDKQDDSTYIIEKGELIPVNLNDLTNYYLVENYVFGIDYSGNYRFQPKKTNQVNGFLDVLYKLCLNRSSLIERLKNNNQDNESSDKHIPFRELITNESTHELSLRETHILTPSVPYTLTKRKL